MVVDDSIVRGTTTPAIISMLRKAGAKEVHMRVSAPPMTDPCYLGVDTARRSELIAARMSVDEIREHIGADTLGYLSVSGLLESVGAMPRTSAVPASPASTRCPLNGDGQAGSGGEVSITYRDSGVDIDAGDRAVDLIKAKVRSTFGPQVLTGLGSFGSLFSFGGYRDPVLVASADGVGTKLKIAFAMDKHDTVGIDLVHHCVNDVLTAGAVPLFFLDYVAMDRVNPEKVAEIVEGLAEGCRSTGCALVGGETAEMPGMYAPGEYDLAGFIVGAVERDRVVNGNRMEEGDLIWGLPSSGLHTNGYSMVRTVLRGEPLRRQWTELGKTLGEELLQPHRSYLEPIRRLLETGGKARPRSGEHGTAARGKLVPVDVRGMAHITGGGLPGNVSRIVPEGKKALFRWGSWPVPPIFSIIQQRGDVDRREMLRVFNMGLGFVVVCPPEDRDRVSSLVPEAMLVGEIVASEKGEKVEVSGG